MSTSIASPWRRRVLQAAVIIGVGPWGGLALGAAFGGIAIALGAPRSYDSWGLGVGMLGFMIGWPISSILAMRLVDRSPRALGGAVVLWAVLVGAASVADSSGWDTLLVFFAPAAVLAVLAMRRWR